MMSPQSYIPVVIRLTTLASSAYDNGSRSYLERCPSRRTEDDAQIDIGCPCHRLGEAIDMAAARTVSLLVPFLASTAALQLALSPCRAPALPRRAGAPCMKYSAINDLSLLLTDTEVSSLALRRVSAARLEPRHPASPHTHTHTHTHTPYIITTGAGRRQPARSDAAIWHRRRSSSCGRGCG